MRENLTFHEPDELQLDKFRRINEMSQEEQDRRCIYYDDCSICPMAIHQELYSTMRHICTQGMSEEEFRRCMADADCYY